MSIPYQVVLPIFQGPLDLLLHLIEKQELEITQVSLAAVTDQYLEYLRRLERIRLDNLAEFILVAAQLLLIKSRALLPRPEMPEELSEEDAGQELVQRLVEYRKFKTAAQELKARQEEGLRAYPRQASPPATKEAMPLEGVTLNDLAKMVHLALRFPPVSGVDEVISPLKVTIPEKIAELRKLLAKRQPVSFKRLLAKARSRLEIIVIFLAILQLVKDKRPASGRTNLLTTSSFCPAPRPVRHQHRSPPTNFREKPPPGDNTSD